MTIFVTLQPLGGKRGQTYNVLLNGEIIALGSRDPEHDAARVLLRRGITGRMTTLGPDGRVRMHFDIEETAKWSMEENASGLRRRRWKPFSRWDVFPPERAEGPDGELSIEPL